MPSRPPTVSRRTLIAGTGVLGVAGLAGCSFDSLDPTSDDPTITPSGTPSGTPSSASSSTAPSAGATPDPAADDGVLVEAVLAAIAAADRTARGNRRAHRDLATTLRRFESLHRAHADELGDLPAATGRATRRGETSAQALARVDRAEGRLQRTLVDAATSAGSGALAQTLASMAAGVAQLRTTLDRALSDAEETGS